MMKHKYLRAPVPILFPVDNDAPQSAWRREARALLAQSIERHLAGMALMSANGFLYWDPTDPQGHLAPDVAVRTPSASALLSSWKTWEHGAPHVAVELVSHFDQSMLELEDLLARYRRAGVREVVRFDHDEPNTPVRLWDFFDGDLVERDPEGPDARLCDTFELYWCVQHHAGLGRVLRLSHDEAGELLVPSPAEVERAEKAVEREAELEGFRR
jgi:Uma2 family endonuclease